MIDRGALRAPWLWLALATLLAAALRLPFLDHQSLWFDETYTREILGQSSLSGLWHHVRATESTPPLSYLLSWCLKPLLGRGAVAMRLVPALALTAAVPVSFAAFRRLIGDRAALAAAAVLAVSPMLVAYSTDARSYGLFGLSALFTVWGFAAVLERGSGRRCALWALACIACIWTHYFGAFLVGAEIVLLAWFTGGRSARRRLLGVCALTLAGVAPLLTLVWHQSGDQRAGFIAGTPLGPRLIGAVRELSMGANVPRTWLEAAGLSLACLAAVAGAALALRAGRPGPRAVLALTVLVFGAPLLLARIGVEDRFYARNVIAALPLAAGLAAPALLHFRAAPLAAYLALCVLTSVWVATDWRYEQLDWRGALTRVEGLERAAPVIAFTTNSGPVLRSYRRRAEATAPLRAARVWVAVEPIRAPHHRGLGPGPLPPGLAVALDRFRVQRELALHGFRLLLLAAPAPALVDPRRLPGALLLPAGR